MKRTIVVICACLMAVAAAASSFYHMRLTTADMESEFPSLAWNGSQLGVAWMDGRDGNQEIYFRMANMKTKIVAGEHRLTNSSAWDDNPKLCWTGSEFGVSFVHEQKTLFDLMFQKLSADGKPKGKASAVIRSQAMGKHTAICPTGAGFAIVATEVTGLDGNLVYRYVDETGKPLGDPVTLTSGPGRRAPASFVRAGMDLALFYLDSATDLAYMLRLDPFGNPKDQPIQLNPPGTKAGLPSADFNGSYFLAAWPQKGEGQDEVMAALISNSGQVLSPPYPLTKPGADRPSVAVAASTAGFGATWFEIKNETRTLKFRKLDSEGKPSEAAIELYKPRPLKVVPHAISIVATDDGYVIARSEVVPPMNTEIILTKVPF